MTRGKRIVAQFCGGYLLEDGTVVVEQQEDGSEKDLPMDEARPATGETATDSAGKPEPVPPDSGEKG